SEPCARSSTAPVPPAQESIPRERARPQAGWKSRRTSGNVPLSAAMHAYRRLERLIASFLALLFFGGLAALPLPQMEGVPRFSWFRFRAPPNTETRYSILLRENAGRPVDPPRLFQEADGFVNEPHAVTAYKITQFFGRAAARGDLKEAEQQRRLLERNYL